MLSAAPSSHVSPSKIPYPSKHGYWKATQIHIKLLFLSHPRNTLPNTLLSACKNMLLFLTIREKLELHCPQAFGSLLHEVSATQFNTKGMNSRISEEDDLNFKIGHPFKCIAEQYSNRAQAYRAQCRLPYSTLTLPLWSSVSFPTAKAKPFRMDPYSQNEEGKYFITNLRVN